MRKFCISLTVLLAFFGISSICYSAAMPTMANAMDKIVVVVNSEVITQSEVNQAMQAAKQQLAATNAKAPSDSELRKQVIDRLIDLSIERQLIKQANIVISDSELNAAIASIAKSNNLSMSDFKTAVERSGISFVQYRKQISEQMQISRLEQSVAGHDITVTDQEVQDYLKKYKDMPDQNAFYHIENILVPVSVSPTPEELQNAKAEAQNIMKQLRSGKDFSQVAAAESGGAAALRGGDLGWRQLPELPTVFAEAVKTMRPGDIAGPLQAPNGFHIIKLIDVRNSSVKLDAEKVKALIYRRKIEEQVQIWLKQTREAAYIQYMQ